MSDSGVAFDYEDDGVNQGYYHVYALSGPLDDENVWLEPFIALTVPETDANTADIMAICDALNRIASRM